MQVETMALPSQAAIRAAEHLITTRALRELMEEKVVKYENEILQSKQWPMAEKWVKLGIPPRVITARKDAFLLEKDAYQEFLKLSFEQRDRLGIVVARPDNCPLLELVNLEFEARHLFLMAMEPQTKIKANKLMSSSPLLVKSVEDLCLKLVGPLLKPHERFGIESA